MYVFENIIVIVVSEKIQTDFFKEQSGRLGSGPGRRLGSGSILGPKKVILVQNLTVQLLFFT